MAREIHSNTLQDIGTGKDFPKRTWTAQEMTERADKWDGKKLKSV